MDFIVWGKNERRLLMEKIKTALKAVAIFFIMYVIISGNGDDTFFAWIIMGISLVLTKLFLDESIKLQNTQLKYRRSERLAS